MATSLLHALLEQSHAFTFDDFERLHEVTQRLLVGELYEALMRDPDIMPTLVRAILHHQNDQSGPVKELFDKLVTRIGADYDRISRP
jgi:hypothetical protein